MSGYMSSSMSTAAIAVSIFALNVRSSRRSGETSRMTTAMPFVLRKWWKRSFPSRISRYSLAAVPTHRLG